MFPLPVRNNIEPETLVSWDEEELTQPEITAPIFHDQSAGSAADTEVILATLQPILNSVRATLINFEDTTGMEIDEVLICGGGSALAGLRQHLTEDLGVPVRRITPHEITDIEPTRFALALAIGRQAAGMSNGREIDMRQDELAFKGDLATLGNFLRIGVLAAAAMLVFGTGWFGVQYTKLSQQLSTTEEQIRELALSTFPGEVSEDDIENASDALGVMQLKSTEAAVRVDALGSILSDIPPTLSVLRQLSDAMPPASETRIDVREMSISQTTITM